MKYTCLTGIKLPSFFKARLKSRKVITLLNILLLQFSQIKCRTWCGNICGVEKKVGQLNWHNLQIKAVKYWYSKTKKIEGFEDDYNDHCCFVLQQNWWNRYRYVFKIKIQEHLSLSGLVKSIYLFIAIKRKIIPRWYNQRTQRNILSE